MSRRSLPPGEPRRRRPWTGPMSFGGAGFLAMHVLAREAIIGIVLWGCRSTTAVFDIGAGLVCLVLVVLGSRRFGVIGVRGWSFACKEGILLFIGASCFANVLLFIFGVAPWFEGGPR